MASGYEFPSPVPMDPLGANLDVLLSMEFDVGIPLSDRAAKLAQALSIPYDQVIMMTHDFGATWEDNDISLPKRENLVQIYGVMMNPEDAYVVGVVITCEMGEVTLYCCTDLNEQQSFDPPGPEAMLPIPLTSGGIFCYVNNHDYERALVWQTQTDVPIYLGEILAGSFLPSRLSSYIFLRTKGSMV